MRTFASDVHRRHHVPELDGCEIIRSWECPERADVVFAAVSHRHPVEVPDPLDRSLVERVHDQAYVEFLESAWAEWVAAGETGPAAMGGTWPARRMGAGPPPTSIRGRLGYHGFAADCSIADATWAAAAESAAIAVSATNAVLGGDRAAFGLCRPPGHHATVDQFGGYCYLNNAAIAAQRFLDAGVDRVAVLDVDYHHGNGTQDIFYERADVHVCSIHADPAEEFPYFVGHADERGSGAGTGYHQNLPLPCGSDAARWFDALDVGLGGIASNGCEALVVSLGVDTYEGDPISSFRLTTGDYPTMGRRIARLGLPTVLLLEGGYAVAALGENVLGVLDGLEETNASTS